MIVRELVTKLGFDADDKEVSSYENAMKGLKTTILGVGAAIAGIGAASFAFANSIAAQGNSLAKTAKGVGLSLKDYQELEYVLGRISTLSKDQVAQGFRDASSRLALARREAGAMRDEFIKLGFTQEDIVSGGVSTNDVFMRLSEMAQDSTTEVSALVGAQRIFGEEVGRLLGPALRDTTDSVDDLRGKFQELSGGFSEEGASAAEAYEDNMLNLMTVFDSLKIAIGEGLMPILGGFVRVLTDIIVANKRVIQTKIKEFFEALYFAAKNFYQILKVVWTTVDGVVTSFTSWENVIRALSIALMISSLGRLVTVLKVVSKWALAIGANFLTLKKLFSFTLIGALTLFLDDLWNWYQGNDSILGRVFGSWESTIKKIKKLLQSFGDWVESTTLGKMFLRYQASKNFMKSNATAGGSQPQFLIPNVPVNPASDLSSRQRSTNSTQNINVNTKAELVVPPGSTEQQKEAMKKQADQIFDEYNRQITNSIIEFKAAE